MRSSRSLTLSASLAASLATSLAASLAAGLVALAPRSLASQPAPRGGNGSIYIGTYHKQIYRIDEATMRIADSMPVTAGIPIGTLLSYDKKRMYALDARYERVEVFDLAQKKAIDTFSLTTPGQRVMLWGINVEPRERFAVLLVKTYKKLLDRWEVGTPKLVKYDLRTKAVTDTIPWPKGEEREFAQILFSPDGGLMYFFGADVLVFDTQTLKQVDRWELARSLDEGMGRFNFGFPQDIYDQPGFYTGLFTINDPVQNRAIMGVASVNLTTRNVDFYTLGPAAPVSFRMAPGKKKAYGLRSAVGNYEFWTFDLESRRVTGKTPFNGRPRMGMTVSSNGQYLYIHTAGRTIDMYDTSTFKLVRTITLDADMTSFVLIPPATALSAAPAGGR